MVPPMMREFRTVMEMGSKLAPSCSPCALSVKLLWVLLYKVTLSNTTS